MIFAAIVSILTTSRIGESAHTTAENPLVVRRYRTRTIGKREADGVARRACQGAHIPTGENLQWSSRFDTPGAPVSAKLTLVAAALITPDRRLHRIGPRL